MPFDGQSPHNRWEDPLENIISLAEEGPRKCRLAIEALVAADPKQAAVIVEQNVLEILASKDPRQCRLAIEALVAADKDQAAVIVGQNVLNRQNVLKILAKEDPEQCRYAIEALVKADKDQVFEITQRPALMAVIPGEEGITNFLSREIYNFAKKCDDEKTNPELGIEKTEKGYVIGAFKMAVSEASPGSKRHTLMLVDPKDSSRAMVLVGCFKGTLDEFKQSIEKTHPNSDTPDREHYDGVHAMMKSAAQKLGLH